MDWFLELLFAGRLLLATLLGGCIGWERERHQREAGIRTYAAVALGSCAFSLISLHVGASDPTRIAAQVVTGMGFIGAGVILQQRGRVTGLTTAATLWATAAVGMASGFGMYVLAILAAALIFLALAIHHWPAWPSMKGPGRRDVEDGSPDDR
jgi:putative Mg2+ transporter-C (MgtC) family protein